MEPTRDTHTQKTVEAKCRRLNEKGRTRGGKAFPESPSRAQEGDRSKISMGKVKGKWTILYHWDYRKTSRVANDHVSSAISPQCRKS